MLVISKSNERKHLPVGDVVLTKGKNKVEDEVMEQNLQNPLIQQAMDNGVLIIPDTEQQDTEPQQEEEVKKELPNPDDFTVNEFINTFVANEDRVEVLEKYIKQEKLNQNRTTLIDAVEEQLSEVK